MGTGGCFSGNAEVYKAEVPGVRCIALEPAASPALSGRGLLGGHRLEGMGAAKALGPGRRVDTVVCDSGLKYLQGELYR